MSKIILILIILTTLVSALFIFIWWKKPQIITSILPDNVLGETQNNKQSSSTNKSNEFLNQKTDKLKQDSENTLNDFKDTVYNSAQAILDKTFSKQSDKEVNVNIQTSTNSDETNNNIHVIDLTKDSGIKIKLLKNTPYKLQFKNVPSNSCLYISEAKFEIDDSKIVAIEFQKSGNYSIKVGSCDLKDKVIGEITVE